MHLFRIACLFPPVKGIEPTISGARVILPPNMTMPPPPSQPFMQLAKHLTALRDWGARDVCLVGENHTCSVPSSSGCEGPNGIKTTSMHEMSTPPHILCPSFCRACYDGGVHHLFSNTTPRFGSSRPLPKTGLKKKKTATPPDG